MGLTELKLMLGDLHLTFVLLRHEVEEPGMPYCQWESKSVPIMGK